MLYPSTRRRAPAGRAGPWGWQRGAASDPLRLGDRLAPVPAALTISIGPGSLDRAWGRRVRLPYEHDMRVAQSSVAPVRVDRTLAFPTYHDERNTQERHMPPTPARKTQRRKLPAPADYSDEVTDEHLERISELVDQDQFEGAEEVSGPAW